MDRSSIVLHEEIAHLDQLGGEVSLAGVVAFLDHPVEDVLDVLIFIEGRRPASAAHVIGIVEGRAMAAIYYRFGTRPSYAGSLPPSYETGAFVYKADKVRPVSLIDGWMPGLEEGNNGAQEIVDI